MNIEQTIWKRLSCKSVDLLLTRRRLEFAPREDAIANITLAESADFKDYSHAAKEYTYNANGA